MPDPELSIVAPRPWAYQVPEKEVKSDVVELGIVVVVGTWKQSAAAPSAWTAAAGSDEHE